MSSLGGAKVGVSCRNWHREVVFGQYLGEGVTTPSEILPAHSTSGREYMRENTVNNTLLIFVRSSSNFPLFGAPYLRIGGRYAHALTAIR